MNGMDMSISCPLDKPDLLLHDFNWDGDDGTLQGYKQRKQLPFHIIKRMASPVALSTAQPNPTESNDDQRSG